jgi:hypothetical protein
MFLANLIYRSDRSQRGRPGWPWIVGVWALAVGVLLFQHAFWRDEVRALSLALQGDTVLDMLRGLQGDGHPALWHLLLRGAHAVLPSTAVLPVVAVAVAAAAAILIAWRSPFGGLVVGALLLGRLGVYEYSVMARNYGISMLLMFLFAALYQKHRDRGIALGLVLAALANCNVHSAMLAGALTLFWLLDILLDDAAGRRAALRIFAVNALIAAVGVALCFVTIYPPFNDAAKNFVPAGDPLRRLATALLLPSTSFWELTGYGLPGVAHSLSRWPTHLWLVSQILMSAVLFASVAGLARRPAAVVASLVALVGLSVLFNFVYAGFYRHQGLWLIFLVAMYWIVGQGAAGDGIRGKGGLQGLGLACFAVLLLLQVAVGLQKTVPIALGSAPESRSRELAQLIRRSPELQNATILADPDYLVEALPYYLPNRTYLPREQRFGSVVHFTHKARLDLYLQDILDDARRLRRETGEPVVVLLHERLDPAVPVRAIHEGYNWRLWTSPGQVQTFLAATRRIARFEPVCCNDESYDVYVLD